ncbi:hypothetical protein CBFG_04134 [Clostridiales bacterium 1_7_47FAA]|nr:hypothetical protein CBFG_04134 [Clostridiales bacterium 1_7_47FAA]
MCFSMNYPTASDEHPLYGYKGSILPWIFTGNTEEREGFTILSGTWTPNKGCAIY